MSASLHETPLFWGAGFGRRAASEDFYVIGALLPQFDIKMRMMSLPLWLLAAICLAWPITSYFLRRRREGRGFEVEPTQAEA